MDINTTASAVTANLHHSPPLSKSSPERESQSPPRIQPFKPLSSSNGVLKRHFIYHAPPPLQVAYKECLKNYAASVGGHALDGCGEFMPTATATLADPTSLKCAACGCHRNFHRRDPDDFPGVISPVIEYHPHHPLPPPPTRDPAREPHSPPPISSSYMLLTLGGGGIGGQNLINLSGSGNPNNIPSSRKRFRTKFRQDQKERMFELADKIGWKLQKTNEEIVNRNCSEIGIDRGVFKVWMHNNKSNFAKRSAIAVSGGSSDGNANFKSTEENNNGDHHHHLYNGKNNNESNDPANASSSSS